MSATGRMNERLRRRALRRPLPLRHCQHCGVEFRPRQHNQARCGSEECRRHQRPTPEQRQKERAIEAARKGKTYRPLPTWREEQARRGAASLAAARRALAAKHGR